MNNLERKLKIIRSLASGEKIVIIDEEKEYEHFTEALGGKVISNDSTDQTKVQKRD